MRVSREYLNKPILIKLPSFIKSFSNFSNIRFNSNLKAFTLAEAILTMTILGVIAAIMITTLKPSRFQAEPLLNLK